MPGWLVHILKTRWPLLLVLMVFLCCKIPHLHYGFYIDEGWVYAPAIKNMIVHGAGLMPDALPPDLSRGHPLMFHFLCSVWAKCFGASNVSLHSFALLCTLLLFVAVYECAYRMFGAKTAVIALLLLATRVVIFVQSSMLYPEIMLALFALLSIFCYALDRFLLTSVFLTALFFTKETGMVAGAVLGVHALISLFRAGTGLRQRILRVLSVAIPAGLICLFFVIQKARMGWYIYPEHEGMIRSTLADYHTMFKATLYWCFRGDKSVYVVSIFAILLSIAAAIKQKNARYLFLIPPAVFVFLQAEMFPVTSDHSGLALFSFVPVFLLPLMGLLSVKNDLRGSKKKFTILLAASVICLVLSSSLAQVAYRYVIVVITLFMLFLSICIVSFVEAISTKLFYPALAAVILAGGYGFYAHDPNRAEDCELGAYKVLNVQTHEIAFLEKEQAYDDEIAYGCNWEQLRATDTLMGFLSSNRIFTNMHLFPAGPTTKYVVFTNIWNDESAYHQTMATNNEFRLIYRVQDGKWWAEVYQRK